MDPGLMDNQAKRLGRLPSSAARRLAQWMEYSLDWLGRITSDRIPRPAARELLAYQLPRDAADNAAATPDSDSHVQMLGVWAFEAFTPSTIDTVIETMRRRGWSSAWSRKSDRDLVGWLQALRRNGERGQHELRFVRPGAVRIPTIGHEADLPSFAASAIGQLVAISPSVSGLLLFFVATPETSSAIEAALRTDRRSRARSDGLSIVVVSPELARREAVEALRHRWRDEIRTFFLAHAPGVFSQGETADLPTCELLVGESFDLFAPRPDGPQPTRPAGIIDAAWAPSLFDAEEDPGASLGLGGMRRDDLGGHAILASTREAFEGSVHSLNRPAGEQRHLYGANERFRGIFLQWSLLQLVELYDRRLNAARDRAGRMFRSWLGLSSLNHVQRLTAGLADSSLVARELRAETRFGGVRQGGNYEFVRRPWRPMEDRLTFVDHCRRQIDVRCRALALSTREFNEFLSSQANLSSARTNLRIQVVVTVFAVLSLIFGGLSALEAVRNLTADPKPGRTEDLQPFRAGGSAGSRGDPEPSLAKPETGGR